jgi:hypothetical protein
VVFSTYVRILYMACEGIRTINSVLNQLTTLANRTFIDGVSWSEAYGSCLCVAVGCCQSDILEKIEHYMYEICHR